MTKQDYINAYWAAAQEACAGTPIFPILALAESAVESAWGSSFLTTKANNFFGVKSTFGWEENGGNYVVKQTREVINGESVMQSAKFRKYPTPADSFKDYFHFVTQPNYIAHGVDKAETPEDQIKCIAEAGYATDGNYANLIIEVMSGLKQLLPLA